MMLGERTRATSEVPAATLLSASAICFSASSKNSCCSYTIRFISSAIDLRSWRSFTETQIEELSVYAFFKQNTTLYAIMTMISR